MTKSVLATVKCFERLLVLGSYLWRASLASSLPRCPDSEQSTGNAHILTRFSPFVHDVKTTRIHAIICYKFRKAIISSQHWHFGTLARCQNTNGVIFSIASCLQRNCSCNCRKKNQGYFFFFFDNKPPLDRVMERNGNSKGWYLRAGADSCKLS